MKIYVGNLSQQVSDEELQKVFEPFGKIHSLNIIKDKFSGASKGFAFVEMEAKVEAQAAIQELDGSELNGTHLIVNEARPKSNRSRGGGKPGGGRRW